jgi:hypothetical protein
MTDTARMGKMPLSYRGHYQCVIAAALHDAGIAFTQTQLELVTDELWKRRALNPAPPEEGSSSEDWGIPIGNGRMGRIYEGRL